MSFSKLIRAVLVGLGIFAAIYLVGSQFIGAGIGDFSKHIKNDYYYFYASGYERSIDYSGSERPKQSVIDSRVDEYIIRGDTIYVARTPRISVRGADGILRSELVRDCEYWEINTKNHEIMKLNSNPEITGLRCH